MTGRTQMRAEIEQIPAAIDTLLTSGAADLRRIADEIRARRPRLLITVARGSSGHACSYLKHASELILGLPVAAVGPSVASIYAGRLTVEDSLCLAVSQSGRSPDIVALTRLAGAGGAVTLAITNHPGAPLGQAADRVLDIRSGPELSVAATKTFVGSCVAGLWLLAMLKDDAPLVDAIHGLPKALDRAVATDWPDVGAGLGERSAYTLGRGPTRAMAKEAALKLKETCQLHAESFSAAEVMHGPVSLVDEGFPVLAFAAADAAEAAIAEAADALAGKGAHVFATTALVRAATPVEAVRTGHWLTDPLPLIVSFYAMAERAATLRGNDPDTPRHLSKVTETR